MSKIIQKDQLGKVERWEMPLVEDISGAVDNVRQNRPGRLPTADQIEKIQAQAYQEAYAEGLKKGIDDGLIEARKRGQERMNVLNKLMSVLQTPLTELDRQVEEELVQLTVAIARQLIRREIKTDPGDVIAVVREALAALPVASRDVSIQLHPEDAKLVQDVLSSADGERHWRIIEDPTLTRGDCRVNTDISRIDATVETRLTSIAARLLGGEREHDHGSAGNQP